MPTVKPLKQLTLRLPVLAALVLAIFSSPMVTAAPSVESARLELERDSRDGVRGNPDGTITIVEFLDYQCTYCRIMEPRLAELIKTDSRIRLVIKEFPVLGANSSFAAGIALAARLQGEDRYFALHDRFFLRSGGLPPEMVIKLSKESGLDIEKLGVDVNRPEIKEQLARNQDLARRLGIKGTPNFVIGKKLIPGAIELDELRAIIAEVAAESPSKSPKK
ncbi:MAG: DsbA family protein [Candidatus Pacebacteria bacterium]|nr:DsbA family protein [Candidatus Paceibacterota bacterium]